MASIVLGIVLTGVLLYISQFIALASFGTQFMMLLCIAAILWAIMTATNQSKKDQWVFLRHLNGNLFSKWELAAVALVVSVIGFTLLHLVWQFQIPTLFVTVFCAIIWQSIWNWTKRHYNIARAKREKAIETYKEHPTVPVMERIKQRRATTSQAVPKDVQEEAMNEILNDTSMEPDSSML